MQSNDWEIFNEHWTGSGESPKVEVSSSAEVIKCLWLAQLADFPAQTQYATYQVAVVFEQGNYDQ